MSSSMHQPIDDTPCEPIRLATDFNGNPFPDEPPPPPDHFNLRRVVALEQAIVRLSIPVAALLMDAGMQKYISPEIWNEMGEAVAHAANLLGSKEKINEPS